MQILGITVISFNSVEGGDKLEKSEYYYVVTDRGRQSMCSAATVVIRNENAKICWR
jgi:hypothetical protein